MSGKKEDLVTRLITDSLDVIRMREEFDSEEMLLLDNRNLRTSQGWQTGPFQLLEFLSDVKPMVILMTAVVCPSLP